MKIRKRCRVAWLGNDGHGAVRIELGDNGARVERLVGDQRVEGQSLDERRNANHVELLTGQKHEVHKVAKSVRQGEDLGGYAAFRAANGLPLWHPFAPFAVPMLERGRQIRPRTSAADKPQHRLRSDEIKLTNFSD